MYKMAKILVTFFNCVNDPDNLNAMPLFYETFIRELDAAGNDVAVLSHGMFGLDFEEINEETKKIIVDFAPDICFMFNNSFYDLSEIVSCPIVIYEVDSPRFFSNKECIKRNPNRYLFFIFQQDSRKTLKEIYGVDDKNIFYTPFYTEVYADGAVEQKTNISFIGSKFMVGSTKPFVDFITGNPSPDEWEMYRNCIAEISRNPQVTPTDLVYKYQITSELVARNLNIPEILMVLSGEKRIHVLGAVAKLGLDLYGTENWASEYYGDIALNFCYKNKKIYSLEHNQEIYNTSKIGINVSHLQATSGFPWRVMDIMASNACLVTDYHSDFGVLFPEVVDIIPTYSNPYEAYEICKRLLKDETHRKDIVAGCNAVINERYRFKDLLPKMEEYSGVCMHKQKEK